jgi:hypothetical protein
VEDQFRTADLSKLALFVQEKFWRLPLPALSRTVPAKPSAPATGV